MSFNSFKSNIKRWIPLILFLLALIGIIILDYSFPEQFQLHSDLIQVCVTMTYIYLTYELLRTTREVRAIPLINVELIIVSKLNEFLNEYSSKTQKTEILHELQKVGGKNNIVFVEAENIGEVNAINVILQIKYDKINLGQTTFNASKEVDFGVLKKGSSKISMVEKFQPPAIGDCLKIKDCVVEFKDAHLKATGESPMKSDVSRSILSKKFDQDVVIEILARES